MIFQVHNFIRKADLGTPDAGFACMIQNTIFQAENEADLVLKMKSLWEERKNIKNFFNYGFGSGHMWVKQNGYLKDNNNWITVYF